MSGNKLTDGEKYAFIRKAELINRDIMLREEKEARFRGSVTPKIGTKMLLKKESV